MDITIIKGNTEYIKDCKESLLNSELGHRYFQNAGNAERVIVEGVESSNLYIALHKKECIGFMYYLPNGAFHSFPYLHIIAIKEEYRGKGIGKKMIDFLEELVFENANKIFLVTADFNPNAKRFYERNGYRQVGEIPSLYRKGITEFLLMKEKN